MCYSAKIKADYRMFVRDFGATIDLKEFARLYGEREQGSKAKIPKALDAWFDDTRSPHKAKIHAMIEAHDAAEMTSLEQELFAQKQRLNKAVRVLESKPTKKATEDRRIATDKIERANARMADLRRPAGADRSVRIFPGHYAPVLIVEDDRRVVKPMRYQCRPAGKPAFYDRKFPGTYNARRDNLEGFWKPLFGHTHGIMIATAFYENVARHDMEGRERADGEQSENVVLEFRPDTGGDMLVACLWSRWIGADGEELLSFAAITDEPPPEVAAAGHDRCIIPIRRENLDAWLHPDPRLLGQQNDILSDREQVFYEHRSMAA